MTRIALLSLFLLITTTLAKPGVPTIRWGNYKYSLVELNPEAVSYESLIKQIHNSVQISVAWDVWYGSDGDRVELLFNNNVVKTGGKDEVSKKEIVVEVLKGGTYSAVVKLCDTTDCSVSAPVKIVVADTDGSHLEPIEYVWRDNNKPYTRATDHVVAGYFVEWGVYDRQYPADLVPVPNLTHLLYGFVPLCGGDGINDSLKQVPGSFEALQKSCAGREDFKVTIHDIWGALQKPQKGVGAWDDPYKGNFGQLMAIKRHNPDLTILPSIGGWTLSDPFFKLSSAENRAVFVESAREYLRTWKFFDGLDIDWEFPGGKGANPELGDPEKDGVTYVQLLKELREMLNDLSKETGKKYQLTSAISAGYDKISIVNYENAQEYLDHIFVMTYDFKGAWSNTDLGYHTTLYSPSWNAEEKYTAEYATKELLKQNVNSKKIVLAVAMYGRGWTGVHDIKNNNPFTGVAQGPIKGTWESGVVDYKDLIQRYTDTYYDSVAQAAYAFAENVGDLLTYDNPTSVQAKGKFVIDNNLGGLFAWELDADNGDILNSMNEGLGNKPLPVLKLNLTQKTYVQYICPFKNAISYALDYIC
ncbi:ORF32 [Agrotis segetum granulovirus]|uniref:ORF32 n=1 Tax=Agrotis segetum granulosis virus TaxID=10464 RepID=Q6QXF1_GVAS|nr:ORF32 [Agrotis segetum granulovirus]